MVSVFPFSVFLNGVFVVVCVLHLIFRGAPVSHFCVYASLLLFVSGVYIASVCLCLDWVFVVVRMFLF